MQRRRIVHVHQQHAEEHQLSGLHVEALRIHGPRAHALLQVKKLGIEGAGDVDSRLDPRRKEADQIFVDLIALLGGLLLVGIRSDLFADGIDTNARRNHRIS